MRRWYKDVIGRETKPTVAGITLQTETYKELYRECEIELPENMVRVVYSKIDINDSISSFQDITWAVKSLKPRKEAGPTGLTCDTLKSGKINITKATS